MAQVVEWRCPNSEVVGCQQKRSRASFQVNLFVCAGHERLEEGESGERAHPSGDRPGVPRPRAPNMSELQS